LKRRQIAENPTGDGDVSTVVRVQRREKCTVCRRVQEIAPMADLAGIDATDMTCSPDYCEQQTGLLNRPVIKVSKKCETSF
jgi:hypothetical protein